MHPNVSHIPDNSALPIGPSDLLTSRHSTEVVAPIEVEPEQGFTYYQQKVDLLWIKTRQSILELAELLEEASQKLARPEFQRLKAQVHLSSATLSALRAILKDVRLSNPTYIPYLPDNIYTLYQITFLDDDSFEAAVRGSVIHATCTSKEIRSYRATLSKMASKSEVLSGRNNSKSVASHTPGNGAAGCATADLADTDRSALRQSSDETHESTPDSEGVGWAEVESDERKILVRITIPNAMLATKPAEVRAVELLVAQLQQMSSVQTTVDWA